MASSNQSLTRGPKPKADDKGAPKERDSALVRQRALGRQLRALFDEVKNEPVPQAFLDLLSELERKDENRED